MVQNLFTPILDDGLLTINFFNGRLLTGEDLSEEQAANRDLLKRLGRAAGSGVVSGLQVERAQGVDSPDNPAVTIRQGLAVNRRGFPLCLPADTEVNLVAPTGGSAPASPGAVFADCASAQGGVYAAGDGVYLLTLAPSSGSLGRAPVSGLGNVSAPCNTRYNVVGVQFRLLRLAVTAAELGDSARLRNRVAYKCFGAPDILTDPFVTPPDSYGIVDALRPDVLTECEVPLAVIHLARPQGIDFIDMWSARRRVTPPSAAGRWTLLAGSRRLSESEAMFLQFEDQVEDTRLNETGLGSILATDRFTYLPAAGILPTAGLLASPGFAYHRFFQDQTVHAPVFIEGAQVRALVRESFDYPPIDLSSRELIWLYLVRENRQAIDKAAGIPPQSYLVFASGHMPFRGNARFDVNRWDYSNYSQRPSYS
jgi:hypothetical protein